MNIFNYKFIKELYLFDFPIICTNWGEDLLNDNLSIGKYGMLLKKFSQGDEKFKTAKEINKLLAIEISDEELKNQINLYNKLKNERKNNIRLSMNNYYFKLTPIMDLASDNDEIWGSKRQYLTGIICNKIFKQYNVDLPPYMFSALNPTGGICGPENKSLYNGSITSPLIIHACLHDASGYCYLYHNKGLGYNYLNTYLAIPTYSSKSCQIMGILTCFIYKYFY